MSRFANMLFRSERATIQSPSVPISEAYDLLVNGQPNHTGIEVTANKTLGLPSFWKGINLITRAVAKTDVSVKKRQGETWVYDRNHPAWFLIRKLPTGLEGRQPITPFIFKQTLMHHVLMTGNGYALVLRDSFQKPTSLVLLNPNSVVPYVQDGVLKYMYYTPMGETRRFDAFDLIHIKGLSFDGLTGYPVLDIMKESLGLNIGYQINQAVMFKNGHRPGFVIQVPWRFKDHNAVADFRRKLGRVHKGLDKAHIPMILENGATASVLNITPEDAQLLQSREFDNRMIANILLLPSSKLNDVAKTAYNSLEQENQSVLDEGYEPWFVVWEEELELKLLSTEENFAETHKIEFSRRKLVQTPFKDRIEGYNKGVQSGWLLRDEVREWEDLNPLDNGNGTKPLLPVNVIVEGEEKSESDNQVVEEEPPQDKEDDSMDIEESKITKAKAITIEQLREISARLFQRRIASASKRKSGNPKVYMDWVLDEMIVENRQAYIELIQPKIALLHILNNQSTDTRTETLVDDYLHDIRNGLNHLLGMVRQEELQQQVELYMSNQESRVSRFVDQLVEKG